MLRVQDQVCLKRYRRYGDIVCSIQYTVYKVTVSVSVYNKQYGGEEYRNLYKLCIVSYVRYRNNWH